MAEIRFIFFVICIVQLFISSTAFPSFHKFRLTSKRFVDMQLHNQASIGSRVSDKQIFDSKLLPPFTEEELSDLMKEFNISSPLDVNRDEEITKWRLSRDFFIKYGLNQTERSIRTVQDVKTEFYQNYRVPILPQYKTFLSDLMFVMVLQTVDARYEYDALHAFGICTQFYTIMKGYALQEEIDVIFNEMMKALGFDSTKLREDAKRILQTVKDNTSSEDEFLNQTEGEIAEIFNKVRNNRFFKYCDSWGIGLCRIMELRGLDVKKENLDKWTASMKNHIFTQRITQTWTEFCSDQLRMQGVEAMQKQILIREKKRAAARLENKAASFEDKRQALNELNAIIEVRRKELIEEAMRIKKKYEPEAYLLMTGGVDGTTNAVTDDKANPTTPLNIPDKEVPTTTA